MLTQITCHFSPEPNIETLNYPELLLLDLPEDSPLRRPILTIENSGKKAAAIVQDLLTLARRGVAVTEVINLNDAITEYLGSLEYEKLKKFHPNTKVEINLNKDPVNAVPSGEAATEYMKTKSADLLILDMIMDPGIDGLQTYRNILKLHPGQRAIIASGFSETDRVKEAHKLGASQYVRKPYTLKIMGLAVKSELQKQAFLVPPASSPGKIHPAAA